MKKCTDCPKYQGCLALCKEAREYVSQDEIKLKEKTVGVPEFSSGLFFSNLSFRERAVVTLFAQDYNRREVAQALGISRDNLRLIIHRVSDK
jgi:FixJ family two-component response regulator